jgi:hypothetical protein
MGRLSPNDAYGDFFDGLMVIDWGGALAVLFWTLVRERARRKKASSGFDTSTEVEER